MINRDEKELRVRLRGGFSDRNKISVENQQMQYKFLDDRARIMLNNVTSQILSRMSYDSEQIFCKSVLSKVYLLEIDFSKDYNMDKVREIIRKTICINPYDEVFSLIEFIKKNINSLVGIRCENLYNKVFETEYVGYRFVNGIIVQITDDTEIDSIDQAAESPYSSVNNHVSKAIRLLSDRDKPDYENSIKESISAVEALCEIITGIKGKEATLGNMLKKIEENGVVIHGALKTAFNILYGYTSDANGIRHAGDIGGPTSTFEEAKFMLVSCSAFINYLIGVSAK